jgi:ribonuclease HI
MGIYGTTGKDAWIQGWIKRGWVTSQKKPVLNKQLWETLLDLTMKLDIEWKWVKAHAGNKYNELVDKLALDTAKSQ